MRALLAALAVTLLSARAEAAPICSSVAKFNESGVVAREGTLTFKVKGIDPNIGKGALASLVDTRNMNAGTPCAGTYFKVYGPGPDLGKVKDELYNVCCKACDTCTTERGGTLGCETWAGEARSSVIFKAKTQTCDIEVRFGGTPNQHSYSVKCDDGAGDMGVGDNLYLLEVNHVSLLEGFGGAGKIDGASVLSEQFCYEPITPMPDAGVVDGGPATPTLLSLPVAEDVTASSAAPTVVYADVNDLSCGDDSEAFFKFVVPASVGIVKKATLHLTNAGTSSAEGDGGALFAVSSNAWSEATLTWNTRPARGARLGRVGPVSLGQKVSLDVTGAVPTAGTYSFVLAVEATDRNGTHFASKEVSAAKAPTLELEYTTVMLGSDAGVADTSPPSASTDAGVTHATPPTGDPEDFRGGCQSHGTGRTRPWLVLAIAAMLLRRRARRETGRSSQRVLTVVARWTAS